MTKWHPKAHEEIATYARSRPPGSGRMAGQIYEFAQRMTSRRAESLPSLGPGNPDIRWWDFTHVTIYFRVDVRPIRVVHVGESRTPQQRSESEKKARSRC